METLNWILQGNIRVQYFAIYKVTVLIKNLESFYSYWIGVAIALHYYLLRQAASTAVYCLQCAKKISSSKRLVGVPMLNTFSSHLNLNWH